MSIYTKTILNQENFKKSNQKTIQLSRTDKKSIKLNEINKMTQGLYQAGQSKNKKTSLLIRGLSNAGWFTLKGFDQDVMDEDDYIDYFNNRVKSTDKFNDFYQLQITLVTYDKYIGDRNDLGHYKVSHPQGKKDKITKDIFINDDSDDSNDSEEDDVLVKKKPIFKKPPPKK
jgi:hypothetical protein